MRKVFFAAALTICCAYGSSDDVKVYKDGEAPSVEELKNFFETSRETQDDSLSGSRLGKSKGLTIGGSPKNTAKSGKEISLPIKFANNSYEIQNDSNTLQILNNIKQALQSSKVTLVVEGHTNAVGGRSYNYDLSQKRAEAVRQYLVENGINGDVLIAKGKGYESPLSGSNPKDPDNRRVQFRVAN